MEALNKLFISEGSKKEELNELIKDIITKCNQIFDINYNKIKLYHHILVNQKILNLILIIF